MKYIIVRSLDYCYWHLCILKDDGTYAVISTRETLEDAKIAMELRSN